MKVFDDVQTGGAYVGIRFVKGTYAVLSWDYVSLDPEILFKGSFDDCSEYVGELLKENVDFDLNL